MKKIFKLLLLLLIPFVSFGQSSISSSFPAGGLKLTGSLSSTLQAIKDKAGNTSPLKISNSRIALGTATGTGLLNFPDAGTTPADGIWFGSGSANLYRAGTNILCTDGFFNIKAPTLTGSQSTTGLSLTQTWNTTGNPTALFVNVTNTASGVNSNVADFQLNSLSIFKFTKGGFLDFAGVSGAGGISFGNNVNKGVFWSGNNSSITVYQQFTAHQFNVFNGSSYARRATLDNTGLYVGTGVIKSSAGLELESTTQGLLPPRMTTTQKNAIASPAAGLLVYDITTNRMCYWNGNSWIDF